jgi:peptidoglycan/LPS O-acetylase OafA/YrhL
MKDSPNLDMLRTLAVACVVVGHLAHTLGWDAIRGYDFATLGRMGVAVFFVHTTLVLMLSLQRHGAAPLPFYVRRAFRIYPLAMVMVLLTMLDAARYEPIDWKLIASNLLLVQNLTGHESRPAPLWSLPLEVQMYVVLPLLFALARRTSALLRLALLWLAAVAAALATSHDGVASSLLQYVPCFLPGVLAFILRRTMPRLPWWSLPAFVVLCALVVPCLHATGVPEAPLFWTMCAALGALIPGTRELRLALLARSAATVAKYSYGIYFTHLVSMGVAFVAFPGLPRVLQWAIFFAALASLSCAAYRWIERPGIAFGVRLAERIGTPRIQVQMNT